MQTLVDSDSVFHVVRPDTAKLRRQYVVPSFTTKLKSPDPVEHR